MRGSTNAVWETFEKYEQIVNYVDLDFSAKQDDWTESGGTFEYTEAGLHQTLGGSKGTIAEGSWYYKKLFIPINITKEGFEFRCTHKIYTSANAQLGNFGIRLRSNDVQKIGFGRSDAWAGTKGQSYNLTTTQGSTNLIAISENAALNGTVRTDIVKFDGTTVKASANGTSGNGTLSLDANIDEILIQFGAMNSSSYPIAEILISEFIVFNNDDWQTLASKAGITASSIDDILTASDTLLANKDAVNFMVARCTGTFMISAVENETFITALNSSEYKTVVQENEHWAKFLATVA